MARGRRNSSRIGYLHLILRGNNKQIIFEETDDYRFFLSRLGKFSREADIRICAYCLMENHVHLLVNDAGGNTPEMMQKLGVSYTKHFNQKYERVGHLFQGRYLSEPVEDEVYLLTVFRYILNNSRKAGICSASRYRWNSYKAYFRPESNLDLDYIRNVFKTEDEYKDYIDAFSEDACLEYDKSAAYSDTQAQEIIKGKLKIRSGTELQVLGQHERNKALQMLKKEGLTIRQIERLTGISRNIIQRS